MKTTLIEKRIDDGAYGFDTESMILDTDTHGRIYITDGYGGENSPEGGCYRWKYGLAIQLKPTDTFDDLDAPWNEIMSTLTAASAGHDPDRPLLDWNGFVVASIAKRHKEE